MLYEYTYRNAAGALATDVVESADRASAFSQLKAKGVAVVSLKEASKVRRGPTMRTPSGKAFSVPALRGLMAGAIVVVMALGVWLLLPNKTKSPAKPVKGPKTVSAQATKGKAVSKPALPTATNAAETVTAKAQTVALIDAAEQTVQTNQTVVATNNVIVLPTNELSSVHRNATEQLLMWVFMTPLGNMPPPLPKLPKCDEKRMWQILTSPIPIKEEDTARQAEAKQMIELAKKELKEYLRKGGDINEFFNYYHGQLKLAHMQRQESQREALKVCRDEEPEVARAYVEKINKDLGEKGISPIKLPPKFKEKLGLE